MRSVLLAFVGVYAAWAIADNSQTTLGDTDIRVTGGRPPVPGAALPTVTRKFIQINGVECKSSPAHGQGLLIKR